MAAECLVDDECLHYIYNEGMSNPSEKLPQPLKSGNISLAWVELLYEIIRQFASTLDLDEVLGKVLSLTVQSVGANEGSIFLLDNQGWVIRSILARGNLPPEVKFPTLVTVMSKGLAGWVYENRKADIVRDTRSDPRWVSLEGDTLGTRSAIGVPLIRRDKVIGILTLTHPEPEAFTHWHLELMNAIAHQAAAAVENARLFTQANNERQMLQAVIAGVQDAILVTDMRNRIILYNPAARQNLGLSGQLRGKRVDMAISEPAILDFYHSASEDHQVFKQVTLEDGRVFDCSLARVAGVGVVLTMHDVTAFKKLDTAKTEFVSQVSHDLKSPLMLIGGYAAVLEEDLTGEHQLFARTISRTVDRMRALIDNLLDLERIEMGIETEFKPLDVGYLVQNVSRDFQETAQKKNIKLNVEITEGLPKVNASSVRLGQAVSNLLSNALKFTPEGGEVTVYVGFEEGRVVVRVSDSGPGIPPGMQSKLFQKFAKLGRQETKAEEGHGLGLAIVKTVVEAHQGRIWVVSREGEGSTFAFSLPPADEG